MIPRSPKRENSPSTIALSLHGTILTKRSSFQEPCRWTHGQKMSYYKQGPAQTAHQSLVGRTVKNVELSGRDRILVKKIAVHKVSALRGLSESFKEKVKLMETPMKKPLKTEKKPSQIQICLLWVKPFLLQISSLCAKGKRGGRWWGSSNSSSFTLPFLVFLRFVELKSYLSFFSLSLSQSISTLSSLKWGDSSNNFLPAELITECVTGKQSPLQNQKSPKCFNTSLINSRNMLVFDKSLIIKGWSRKFSSNILEIWGTEERKSQEFPPRLDNRALVVNAGLHQLPSHSSLYKQSHDFQKVCPKFSHSQITDNRVKQQL